ncbi:MAG TPA: hypothetical protein PKC18_13205, partial [Lacipirellulaceae bacterium]|nr:hypothetical protein [Lacipirellulaceae bacterium]
NFGVDIALVQQHLRKAFPRILATELTNTNLTNLNTNTEAQTKAIYFWLSGFSADVTRPLTGPGGPFSSTPGTNEPLYDFDKSRLLPAAASLPYTATTLPTYTASGM